MTSSLKRLDCSSDNVGLYYKLFKNLYGVKQEFVTISQVSVGLVGSSGHSCLGSLKLLYGRLGSFEGVIGSDFQDGLLM